MNSKFRHIGGEEKQSLYLDQLAPIGLEKSFVFIWLRTSIKDHRTCEIDWNHKDKKTDRMLRYLFCLSYESYSIWTSSSTTFNMNSNRTKRSFISFLFFVFFSNHRLLLARRIFIRLHTYRFKRAMKRIEEREGEEKRRVTKRRPHITDRTRKKKSKRYTKYTFQFISIVPILDRLSSTCLHNHHCWYTMMVMQYWEKRKEKFQMHSEQVSENRQRIVRLSSCISRNKNGQVYRLKTKAKRNCLRFFFLSLVEKWALSNDFCFQFRANAIVIIHRVNTFIHLNTYAIFYFKTDATTLFCVVLVWTIHSCVHLIRLLVLVFFQLWISLLIKLFTHRRQPICHITTVLSFKVPCNRLLHL